MNFICESKEDVPKLRSEFIKVLNGVGTAKQSGDNPYTSSPYATLKDANDTIKQIIEDNGFGLTQDVTNDDSREFIKITNHLINEIGMIDFDTLSIPVAKKDAQAFGSAITYARRYSLTSNFNISVEDDDGNAASRGNNNQRNSGKKSYPPKQSRPAPMTNDQNDFIHKLSADIGRITNNGKDFAAMKVFKELGINANSISEIEASRVIRKLRNEKESINKVNNQGAK